MNDAALDNDYRYNGKELHDDFGLNWYAYGARWYDPAVGRFTGVDPIADQFAWVTPYNYAENEPVGSIDLWGLQKVSFHIRSFAPFETFGGGFRGDGANRGFSNDPRHIKDGGPKYKIRGDASFEATSKTASGLELLSYEATGSESKHSATGVTAFSEAEFEYFRFDYSGGLKFHLSGNNDAMLWGATPDIDINGEALLNYEKNEDGSGNLNIDGKIWGDRFPASETFITDQSGNGVFLGVSGAKGNPFTNLIGNNTRRMSSFKLSISFNSDGNISGVNFNGQNYSVQDWNALFTNQDPQDGNANKP